MESVSIYSLIGQEIKQFHPNADSVVLDIADIQAGVYVVKVTAQGATATSRLVKK